MKTENKLEMISPMVKNSGATYRVKEHCLIVELKSDLDHHVSIQVKEHSDRIIQTENIRHVIFDFSNTSFMDSSGIGVIMGRYKQVKFTGGSLAVTGITPPVDRILKISGLYKIIQKYETIKEALNAF
ncbi:anti-sigma F factor antagonist [[Clostridium] polysaccharolyticum]|uniref:Anti-sigma F factor antagonist n=1 Tax=[Clostridium] polysaccharolyticum TaxID=29364 RepID=A0A1H9Y7X9_9FIRM|nr:anti-sigma F factor antagonist [[Clostridium] polysaccharolyticum]SES64524.1 anti-anti-sigma regulatory factor, SpoIIAA [[Clostridium] polysaccharolyticum]